MTDAGKISHTSHDLLKPNVAFTTILFQFFRFSFNEVTRKGIHASVIEMLNLDYILLTFGTSEIEIATDQNNFTLLPNSVSLA